MTRIMFTPTLAVLLLAMPATQSVWAQSPAAVVAIRNVTVIDGTGAAPQRNANVMIRDGKIESITQSAATRIPAGATVIEGAGLYLVPGLIDTHMHVARLAGTERLEHLVASSLAQGITGIRDASAGGRERELVDLRARIDRGVVLGPRLYVAGSATPENVTRYKVAGIADLVRQLREVGVDGIKLRTLSSAQADTAIAAARAQGLPAFGHTWSGRGSEYTLEALRAGAAGVMHVSGIGPATAVKPRTLLATNWQRAWLQLFLQWIDATPIEESSLIAALIKSGAWLEPTLTTEAFVLNDDYRNWPESKLTQELWGHSYDISREGTPIYTGTDLELAREGYRRMQAFVRRFHEAGGVVLAGTDMLPWAAGGLHEELRLLVEAGLSPLAALQAATRNAARALGWETRTGMITAGRDADLVLLTANPLDDITNTKRIHTVLRAGRVLDRAALDSLLRAR